MDPIYSTPIYLYEYLHIFIYFISRDIAILGLYLFDLDKICETKVWRVKLCKNCATIRVSSSFERVQLSVSPPIAMFPSHLRNNTKDKSQATTMGAICWLPHHMFWCYPPTK